MRKIPLCIAMVLLGTAPAFPDEQARVVSAAALNWADAPAILPKGANAALVAGNPETDGPFVVRLTLPANYKIPAHRHPLTEYVTVLIGSFHIGMGDKLDMSKGTELKAGGFAEIPANTNHYAWATEPTVIQIHGQGPFEMNYADPADDPSK